MSPLQIAAVAVAAVLVLGGLSWRLQLRRRTAGLVAEVLTSPDPAQRAAAVTVLAGRGLGPHAKVFQKLSEHESVPSVRRALAEAVARNQWEPAHDPRILGLRIWAQHELGAERDDGRPPRLPAAIADPAGPAGPADPAGPAGRADPAGLDRLWFGDEDDEGPVRVGSRPAPVAGRHGPIPDRPGRPGVPWDAPQRRAAAARPPATGSFRGRHAAPLATDEPAQVDEVGERAPSAAPSAVSSASAGTAGTASSARVVGTDRAAGGSHRAAGAVGSAEEGLGGHGRDARRVTVMVTGAGGPAGVAVIRALVAQGQRVVAVDSDPSAVGMRLATSSAVVPRATDRSFVPTLVAVARRMHVEALVSTVAEEMVALHQGKADLAGAGVAMWLCEPFVIELCTDKWLFHDITSGLGLPVPATNLGSAEGVPGPWIVKPLDGRGSRDVHRVDDPDDIAQVVASVPNALVQHRVEGREFTVDVLADRDHRLVAAVPRWRLETRGGISTKGETFDMPEITSLIARVTKSLRLEGPANIQGFVGSDGEITLIEVNPRFSGGLPLTLAAGCDVVGEYLAGILGKPLPESLMSYRSGVKMLRHFEEVFEGLSPSSSPPPTLPAIPTSPATVGAVLFDFDDTLAPQAPWLRGAFEAVAIVACRRSASKDRDADVARLHAALLAEAAGGSARGGIIDRVVEAQGIDVPVPVLVEAFTSYRVPEHPTFPGVAEALAALRARVPIGLVSDGAVAIQEAKVRAARLEGAFDVVVFSDSIGRLHRKPDRAPYLRALDDLGVEPAFAAFVGDRPDTDMVGAHALGMTTVRVLTGEYAERPDVVEPAARVEDISGAVEWLLARITGPAATTTTTGPAVGIPAASHRDAGPLVAP